MVVVVVVLILGLLSVVFVVVVVVAVVVVVVVVVFLVCLLVIFASLRCFGYHTPKKPFSLQFQRILPSFSAKNPCLQNPFSV